MDDALKEKIVKLIDDYINSLSGKKGTVAITSWYNEDSFMDDTALDWVDKDSKDLTAELTIGYIIGYITSSLYHVVIVTRRNEIFSKIVRENLQDYLKLTPKEQEHLLKADVTQDEIKEIRDLIKPKISIIRTAVIKALSE